MVEAKNTNSSKSKISLATKSGIIILVVLLGLMATLLLVTASVVKKQTQESYNEMATEIVEGRSAELEKWLQIYINDLRVYSEADVVKDGDAEEIIEWLHNNQHIRNPDYDYMFFCTPEGTSYRDTGLVGGAGALVNRDYHQAMMIQGKETFVGNMVLSKTSGQYVLPIASIAKDRDGNRVGYFVGMLGLNTIKEEIAKFKIGETGYFLLADRSNVMIAHRYEDKIHQTIDIYPGVLDMIDNHKYGFKIIDVDGKSNVIYVAEVGDLGFTIGYIVELNEILTVNRRTQMVVFILGTIIAAVLFVVVFISIKSIVRRLKAVANVIDDLSAGDADLTKRLEVKKKDEIGKLLEGVNRFLEKFHSIMSNIKSSESHLSEAGGVLTSEITETTGTIAEMVGHIGMVNEQINNQTKSVENSASAITQITKNIESLDKMIQGQASNVVEASAAVEEMIGNISSVDKSVIKMVEEFSVLEMDAKNGIEQNSSVNSLIQKIAEESTSMVDANTTIQTIAEQTNLLAMNAAIEAAHAGEAGKGFSVVADEIRKLAETSSEQSNKISQELSNIQNGISKVVAASSESEKAFQSVSTRIGLTGELITQIRGAMEEQQAGSQQILEVLQVMNDSTSQVKGAAEEMTIGGQTIMNDVVSIQNGMNNIDQAMDEIISGTNYVNESTQKLREISRTFTESIDTISNDVGLFKV